MYFHPTVLHPAQKEQIANSYRELADIVINGVDRQRDLHVEAIRDFCNAQEGNIRALGKTANSAQLHPRRVARSVPASLEMWQIAARSGKSEVDVQRQVIELFGRYATSRGPQLGGTES
jgi:hypothetical protein